MINKRKWERRPLQLRISVDDDKKGKNRVVVTLLHHGKFITWDNGNSVAQIVPNIRSLWRRECLLRRKQCSEEEREAVQK
jgi:hypothetical protein